MFNSHRIQDRWADSEVWDRETEVGQLRQPLIEAVPEDGGQGGGAGLGDRATPALTTPAPVAEAICPRTPGYTADTPGTTATLTRAGWSAAWTGGWTGRGGPMPGHEVPLAGSPPAPRAAALDITRLIVTETAMGVIETLCR